MAPFVGGASESLVAPQADASLDIPIRLLKIRDGGEISRGRQEFEVNMRERERE
jgi:hypothetical protein